MPVEGEASEFAFISNKKTRPGDVIRVITGNGGGLGDPRDRPRDKVAADLRDGLISAEQARDIYGYEGSA